MRRFATLVGWSEGRMRLEHCFNYRDFRELARRHLPSPIFNYIDGAADDETTHVRNTTAFQECDLVPNVLAGVEHVGTCPYKFWGTSWRCPSTVRPLRCRGYSITRVSG